MLANALGLRIPTAVCTVYYPDFPVSAIQETASAGRTYFNESILLEAIQAQVPVLDLRLIFTSHEDYANPIEPSVIGGGKLADAICRLVSEHDISLPYSRVFI